MARGGYDMPLLVKARQALRTEAAIAITQVQFIMQVAAEKGRREPLLLTISSAGIQDLDPGDKGSDLVVMRSRVAHQGSPKCSWNACPEGEPSPSLSPQFARQARPANPSISDQKSALLVLLFYLIGGEGHTRDNTPYTGIGKEAVAPIAYDEQGPVFLSTPVHQLDQFVLCSDGYPDVCSPPDAKGAMTCQRLISLDALLEVRKQSLIDSIHIECHR